MNIHPTFTLSFSLSVASQPTLPHNYTLQSLARLSPPARTTLSLETARLLQKLRVTLPFAINSGKKATQSPTAHVRNSTNDAYNFRILYVETRLSVRLLFTLLMNNRQLEFYSAAEQSP